MLQKLNIKLIISTIVILCSILTTNLVNQAFSTQIEIPKSIEKKLLSGINHLYQLEYFQAKNDFRFVAKKYKDRPISYFYLAMVEWIKLTEDSNDKQANKNFVYYIDEAVKVGEKLYNSGNANSNDIFYYAGALGFSARNLVQSEKWVKAYMKGRQALDLMEIAIEKDKNNYDALLGRGIYHYFADKIPDSIKGVLASFDIKGDSKKGLEELKTVMEKGKYARTEAKILLVHIYTWYEKDYYKAMDLSNELIKEYPKNLSFYHTKLYSYFSKGQFESAKKLIENYKDIIKKFPESQQSRWWYRYFFYKGRYYFEKKEYSSAIKYFRKVLILRKDYLYTCKYAAWSLFRMGVSFDVSGKRSNAIKLYKQVLKTDIKGRTRNLAISFINKACKKNDKRLTNSDKKAYIP